MVSLALELDQMTQTVQQNIGKAFISDQIPGTVDSALLAHICSRVF